MAKFNVLFSGSTGNAALVRAGNRAMLIDIGRSCKQIRQALLALGTDISALDGILITHAHIDHVRGLCVLCKQTGLKAYMTADTYALLLQNGYDAEPYLGGVLGFSEVALGAFEVTPFPTEHDVPGSCGYRICTPDDRTCAVCTDLGTVTDAVHNAICGCDLVLLESNYDPQMMRTCRYPYHVKARITGTCGHLSNGDCAVEAQRLIAGGTTRLILGHISQESNTPALAEHAVLHALQPQFIRGQDFLLYTAGEYGMKETVIF